MNLTPKPANIRLFVDAHLFDGKYQGTRTYIKGLYTALNKIDPSIELFFAAHKPEILEEEFAGLTNCSFLQYKSPNKFFRLAIDIPNLIGRYKPHFAHFQYITPFIKNTKFIITTHDLLFNEFPQEFPLTYRLQKNFLFKASIKKKDILTTDSRYSKSSIHKFYKVPPDQIHVIPVGINPEFFEEYDIQQAQNYIKEKYGVENFILYVSRIEPRKNHALLLQIYLELQLWKKNIPLVFVGKTSIEDPQLNQLRNTMSQQQAQAFFLLDSIDNTDLIYLYRACRLFIYPSKAEGFGIPPLEAAATGAVTLCANTTAMADFTFFGENLFDPNNKQEIKQKLEKALSHNRSSTQAQKAAIQNIYNWDKIASAFSHLLYNAM